MSEISYQDSPVAVRRDLLEAHRRQWQRLAEPGAWWSGGERVAIASEVREASTCPLCGERSQALSPSAVTGEHRTLGKISAPALDATHRIASDPGRLSRRWFDETLAGGLSEGQYVELVGVVVTVVSIDRFCRGIGVPLHPLPEPVAGEPSHYRPTGLEIGEAWVPMIANGRAAGPEAGLFGGRRTGNVIRALSLVPDEVRGLLDLSAAHYMAPERMMDFAAGRTLDRSQIELIAGRVSALRECFY